MNFPSGDDPSNKLRREDGKVWTFSS